jgi:spore maturation protein CgeB
MTEKLDIVILGLSITSSWGNGHATTYRSLIKGLHLRGHRVTFLEKDVPWYANQRDMTASPFCQIYLYPSFDELKEKYTTIIEEADCVIVGSYVPEGVKIGNWVQHFAKNVTAFYDIDTPITLTKLANHDYEYLSPDLIPGYDLYLSFTGGPTLNGIESLLGSPKAVPLYCSVDPELYFPQNKQLQWDLGYMGTYSSDRQPGLETLLLNPAALVANCKFVVAGPQYPATIQWPLNVEHIEHIPPMVHRDFYNSQRYTLNITRSDMKARGYSPSVRLFEAAACATPIISDYWEGIETIFSPDEDIFIARNTGEVQQILKNVTEEYRSTIGRNAYNKVLSHHTGEHRAQQLEGYIKEVNIRKVQTFGTSGKEVRSVRKVGENPVANVLFSIFRFEKRC